MKYEGLPAQTRANIRREIKNDLKRRPGILRSHQVEDVVAGYARLYGVKSETIWALWRDGEHQMVER
jgi:hypothetical protein